MKNYKSKPTPPSLDPPAGRAGKGGLIEGRRNFIRKKEDFICEKCGEKVVGDGYTDHCPRCLWGKHVDDMLPGDRASGCYGRMEPIRTIYEKGRFRINYHCQKCGYEFWVRQSKNDDRKRLVELAGDII